MTNELEDNLKQVLGWHKLSVQCLVQIVLGLIAVRTVNLKELACFFSGAAELDSTYRRLQRFFAEVKFPRHVIAQVVAGLFYLPEQGFSLLIERTGVGVKRILITRCSTFLSQHRSNIKQSTYYAGLLLKICSSASSYPFDLARTSFQLYGRESFE